MQETHPRFLILKYRSILLAAIVEEMVVYIVSLTDTIVAGNLVGEEALEVVGLASPFLTIALFLAAVINGGTVRNYSYYLGQFDRDRANRFFSQGLLLAISIGVLAAFIFFLIRGWFVGSQSLSPLMENQLMQYFTVILLYVALEPTSVLLDNIAIAEGGEKFAAVANIVEIVTNVGFSIILGRIFSVAGIGFATIISKVIFMLMILGWFFFKKCGLRFVWYWNFRDCFLIVRTGIVRASTFALSALMTLGLNSFTLNQFGNDALVVLVVVERYLGFSSLFLGISMAIQPLMGTLRGEGNTKAERFLMHVADRIMLIFGTLISVVTVLFAPLLVRILGIQEGGIFDSAVLALRISCATLFVQAILTLFFFYYFVTKRPGFSLLLCIPKDYAFPVGLSIAFAALLGSETGIWFGLMAAPVAAILISFLVILLRGGKEGFPFMIPRDRDALIHIYDFDLNQENIMSMSKTAAELAREKGYDQKIQSLSSLFLEETLMLIQEKNTEAKKKILVECTLITETDGLRLILRDSGKIFDLSDADALPDSFRQYVVGSMMEAINEKYYLPTTGYNRNEFFFAE